MREASEVAGVLQDAAYEKMLSDQQAQIERMRARL
jgi:hypothetical protein